MKIVALLLAATLMQPAIIDCDIRVVFVQPYGETFTQQEQALALASLQGAIDYWQDLAPIVTTLTIASTETITITTDVYGYDKWFNKYLIDDNPDVLVFIIDNSVSGLLLYGDSAGEAQNYYGLVWAVLYGAPGEDALASTLAHELGHVVYDLDDQPRPCATDIMCLPGAAYRQHTLGCESLAQLGEVCRRVWFPVIMM